MPVAASEYYTCNMGIILFMNVEPFEMKHRGSTDVEKVLNRYSGSGSLQLYTTHNDAVSSSLLPNV